MLERMKKQENTGRKEQADEPLKRIKPKLLIRECVIDKVLVINPRNLGLIQSLNRG